MPMAQVEQETTLLDHIFGQQINYQLMAQSAYPKHQSEMLQLKVLHVVCTLRDKINKHAVKVHIKDLLFVDLLQSRIYLGQPFSLIADEDFMEEEDFYHHKDVIVYRNEPIH